jgi:hypothetical protein
MGKTIAYPANDYEAENSADTIQRMMKMKKDKKLMAATKKAMELKMQCMHEAMGFMKNMK